MYHAWHTRLIPGLCLVHMPYACLDVTRIEKIKRVELVSTQAWTNWRGLATITSGKNMHLGRGC